MDNCQQLSSHLLLDCLIAQGVTHVFSAPNARRASLFSGFDQRHQPIQWIACQQEGAASFMAEAHGKLTARPGVCVAMQAAGAVNAAAGVHTAFEDCTAMVLLIVDVARNCRDRTACAELDLLRFFAPMVKRVERVDDAHRIPEYVARAFTTALNGCPGPVVLVLPEDMLVQSIQPALFSDSTQALPRRALAQTGLSPRALSMLCDLLLKAQRPLVIAGGSGWSVSAAQALQRFAENWSVPVVTTFGSQDIFDNHHPLYAGHVGLGMDSTTASLVHQSDFLLVVGPKLGELPTGNCTLLQGPRPIQKLIHIHANAEELNRIYQSDLAIHTTTSSAALALQELHAPTQIKWHSWTQDCYAAHGRAPVGAGLMSTLHQHLPKDSVLSHSTSDIEDALQLKFAYHGLAHGMRTQLTSSSGSLGYGVPAGVAAALTSNRTVVTTVSADDFLVHGQELATATKYAAKTIVLLVNHISAGNPDFCALAQAYGYAAQRLTHAHEFESALLAALDRTTGTLIELPGTPP